MIKFSHRDGHHSPVAHATLTFTPFLNGGRPRVFAPESPRAVKTVSPALPVIEGHRWYGLGVVARLVGVATNTVRRWVLAGRLPAVPTPGVRGKGHWRVKGDDIFALVGDMERRRGAGGVVTVQPARDAGATTDAILATLRRERRAKTKAGRN